MEQSGLCTCGSNFQTTFETVISSNICLYRRKMKYSNIYSLHFFPVISKLASPCFAHSLHKHKLNFSMRLHTRIFQSKKLDNSTPSQWTRRAFSTFSQDPELKPFLNYLDNLKNYEKLGVPKNAGTNSSQGFDLGPMSRLMHLLGNPQSNFKTVHIAGTKGKGSTAAFLSNILRSEGYSVGCYTSPHIRTIRERMSLGKLGQPVSAKSLNCVFNKSRKVIDKAIELENGRLSHFEVLTAMAFTLFAEENVDIAVIEAGLGGARDATNIISSSELALSVITTIGEEHLAALGGSLESIAIAKSGIVKHGRPVVLGGPFQKHIESILRDQASLMRAPVVLASDDANRCVVKQISKVNGKPCQSCDVVLHIEKDIPLSIELHDVNLCMPGIHQLQNAATATCAALCLRDQGWRISDLSIRSGLECTYMLGRSQFLTSTEVEALGLPGATILLDGAHTKDSAKALVDMIQMTFPGAPLILVVAMATDKDHSSFAREFLSGRHLEAVFCTEVDIGGGKSRTTAASVLRDHWVLASKELGLHIHPDGWSETENRSDNESDHQTVVTAESSLRKSMKNANDILYARGMNHSGIIVVTGSLHIVSSVLASLHG